jgi:rRNA biogenesis protein RRP5
MRVLGQIVSVQPLALVVSLPNQLLGHVPITNVTTQLTSKLEALDEQSEQGSDVEMDEDAEDVAGKAQMPDLLDMFKPGQYVRTIVIAVHSQGATISSAPGSRPRDETERASRRVELSLVPSQVNAAIVKADLKSGYVRACPFLVMYSLLSLRRRHCPLRYRV